MPVKSILNRNSSSHPTRGLVFLLAPIPHGFPIAKSAVALLVLGYKLWTLTTPLIMHKVFVYGTLKRGEPNHYWLEDEKNGVGRYWSDGVTVAQYPLIIATKYNIPFILYMPGSGYNIQGEIFDVDDDMLAKLDILEDHPNYYIREQDEILIYNKEFPEQNPKSMQCWVYFLKNFKRELLLRPRYETYSSTGPHGLVYMDRSQRDPSYDHRNELKPESVPEPTLPEPTP